MRDATSVQVTLMTNESEDGTRYSYIMVPDQYGVGFLPYQSFMPYPKRIEFWTVEQIDLAPIAEDFLCERIMTIAEEHDCDPWTVRECVSAMQNMDKGLNDITTN